MDAAVDRKPWLKSYPPGVPADMPPLEFESLPQMLEASVARYRDRIAFESFGVGLSYGDLDRLSRDFAAYLQGSLGLKKGDRVAVMLPNILQYPIAVFGILRAGLTVVNVNPLYTTRELGYQLKDSGASAIVIFEGAAHALQEALPHAPLQQVIVASIGDLLGLVKGAVVNFVLRSVKKMIKPWSIPGAARFPEALKQGAGRSLSAPPLKRDDLAFLQYTGGTTGVSKGAMLYHRHILANVQQLRAYYGDRFQDGREVAIAPLPFYHILALVLNCMMGVRGGSKQVLIANPRDIPSLVKTMSGGLTFFVGVNTLFNALVNNPEFAKLDFSGLRITGGGGAPVQLAVAKRWKEITGCVLSEGYGLTETSGAVSANPPGIAQHTGTTGLPIPGTEVEIRDEVERALPHGAVGQVFVRGPQVMAGYWQRPDETAKVLRSDGWLATGDMGLITPEGQLKIVDRVKDLILVSGFNVYPNEIEEVMAGHPGILESCAIGVPDQQSGEAVTLFVVRKDPNLTKEQVIAFCRENLTGYKIPKHVEFRDALPKSAVGKILRRELRPKA
jgi:long-chain acyl-CoA synthetase